MPRVSRVDVQAKQQKLYSSFQRSRSKNAEVNKQMDACKEITRGKQKCKGHTIQPDGWYTSGQGASQMTDGESYKKQKVVTSQGLFKHGSNNGFNGKVK